MDKAKLLSPFFPFLLQCNLAPMASLAGSCMLAAPCLLPAAASPRLIVLCCAEPSKHGHPSALPSLEALESKVNRRQLLLHSAAGCQAMASLLLVSRPAFGLLEADDDEELLEKVKEDRKKKIRKRGEVNAYKDETASLQKAVYNLSKAGQALDKNDFSTASNVLGQGLDVGWIADVKTAFSKVSTNNEEQSEAELFASALASLQSAVKKGDIESSKSAFVASANALEKWSYLTGFAEQLKGL